MTTSTTTIDITPGTSVYAAYVEAIRLARLLNVDVRFTFNGIECYAKPTSGPDEEAANYHKYAEK